eukprot:CAMPEP_0182446748 /NCGR_PEP_ID=MMETSP1172-20130603/5619_1 /TAXON_ID=708627 /ORGANISM="Timspurckia oligopyrenoides, Strain CCMP3278" /LENGTH=286 /DNA_ID=CAMNT_0024642783 /DNA_START=124 /DNA_END=984 /DNA_ORIENTATION=+
MVTAFVGISGVPLDQEQLNLRKRVRSYDSTYHTFCIRHVAVSHFKRTPRSSGKYLVSKSSTQPTSGSTFESGPQFSDDEKPQKKRNEKIINTNSKEHDGKGVFRSFSLFTGYFLALMLMVRRSVMAATLPHERVLLVSLGVILPDLARYSFADLSWTIERLKSSKNPEHVPETEYPYHVRLVAVTTIMKLFGFFVAGLSGISQGAFIVSASQVMFNSMVHLRHVNQSVFLMRNSDRTPILFVDIAASVLSLACVFGLFPIFCASIFMAMVCLYWLSKYDVQLVFKN